MKVLLFLAIIMIAPFQYADACIRKDKFSEFKDSMQKIPVVFGSYVLEGNKQYIEIRRIENFDKLNSYDGPSDSEKEYVLFPSVHEDYRSKLEQENTLKSLRGKTALIYVTNIKNANSIVFSLCDGYGIFY